MDYYSTEHFTSIHNYRTVAYHYFLLSIVSTILSIIFYIQYKNNIHNNDEHKLVLLSDDSTTSNSSSSTSSIELLIGADYDDTPNVMDANHNHCHILPRPSGTSQLIILSLTPMDGDNRHNALDKNNHNSP